MHTRQLTLAKNGHKYIFRYVAGGEDEIMDEVMRMADDTRNNLQWLDAAKMGFRIARNAAVDCSQALQTEGKKHA